MSWRVASRLERWAAPLAYWLAVRRCLRLQAYLSVSVGPCLQRNVDFPRDRWLHVSPHAVRVAGARA